MPRPPGDDPPLDPDEVAPFFRRAFTKATDPMGLARGLTLVATNPAYVALFGYEREEEMLGTSVLDLVAPSARPMVIELARRRAMGEDVPASYVTRALRRDGSEFDVEMRSTAFEVGDEKFILAVHREHVATPDKTLRSEAFYRAMFEGNPAIRLLISPTDGFIIDANQAAVEFYGWSVDELRTMRISDVNTLTDEEVRHEMDQARSGKRRYFRFRHRVADGEERHVEVHSGPVELDGRTLLMSIIHDVTERDALERQLRDAQRLEAIGRLAGAVAHDFNNLLTVVLSSAELMVRKTPADSKLRRLGEDMRFATSRAVDLARDLLAFSRRQLMRPSVIDLNGTVDTMAGVMQRLLGEAVTIQTELARALPPARVDPRQLEQVLMNLVLNARDAMPDGGVVRVVSDVAHVEAGGAVPPGRWITLAVHDEGHGMDEGTASRIFEPYFTTKSTTHGTGLGLATVHGIIHQGGGHITVDSTVGHGTSFTVFLPLAEGEKVSRVAPHAALPAATLPPRTLLLVDDQKMVREVLHTGLEDAGFRVVSCADAEEAEAAFRETPFDVVVTDIVMPGRTGVELAQRLLERDPDLPIVLISGDVRGHDVESLPKAVPRLQKPFTTAELQDVITAVLES